MKLKKYIYVIHFKNTSNIIHFRLNKIVQTKKIIIGEINEREIISKRVKKISSILNYFGKSLLVITRASSAVSIFSFAVG